MSTKDRTREKLMNSMRKTKAVINEQPDSKQAHAETYASPTSKKAESKPARSRASKSESRTQPPAAPSSDPYQSRGRVWPD